ncbi:hypothetical protein [Subtercola boreus]|uniref:Uncharacterized protein n=1 Tax=Subtercola boreus TaxID=120213 RepID=A0A3E0W6I9_9MICO|nr:hypothetical protein [Subtercola boreus]RFA17813.1 hypothetical protein B7R24_16305 [Subtercola boreus]RFA17884.1 hypothetical protein B7R23_16375 [Subtercola boreus]RFA24613.1 hypothetical protein B7R25_16395 [Subtercola boreus]
MTTNSDAALYDQVRAWAEGSNPLVAAVELVIRAGLIYDRAPWVRTDNAWKTSAVDFDVLLTESGTLSSGQQHLIRIAASLGQGTPVDLRETTTNLDLKYTQLVMTAIAHAAGLTEPGTTIESVDGLPTLTRYEPLAAWPTS